MELNSVASDNYIDGLAQAAPFRFVDQVHFLDDSRVVTELRLSALPHRFVDSVEIEAYTLLEFAAQSSGLILRGRKKGGGRGVITSITGKFETQPKLEYPLQLESFLVEERFPLFGFRFQIHAASALVFGGTIGIFIRL